MSSHDYKGYNQTQQPLPTAATTTAAAAAPIAKYSISCVCPYCHQSIVTRVEKTNGLAPWLCAGGLVLVGCVFGCCMIPFCMDSLKDVTHYCPNCNAMIRQKKVL